MWICEIEGLREHGRLIKRVGHEWRTEHFDDCRLIKIAKNRGVNRRWRIWLGPIAKISTLRQESESSLRGQ